MHIAPGCGAEDFELSKVNNLPVLVPLDEDGIYVPKLRPVLAGHACGRCRARSSSKS